MNVVVNAFEIVGSFDHAPDMGGADLEGLGLSNGMLHIMQLILGVLFGDIKNPKLRSHLYCHSLICVGEQCVQPGRCLTTSLQDRTPP